MTELWLLHYPSSAEPLGERGALLLAWFGAALLVVLVVMVSVRRLVRRWYAKKLVSLAVSGNEAESEEAMRQIREAMRRKT